MPPADQFEDNRLRVFAYGKEKTRKTWWMLMAVRAGLNVHLFDADDGAGILKTVERMEVLTPFELSRINVIRVVDKLDAAQSAIFFTSMMANKWIVWDEITREIRTQPNMVVPEHSHYVVNARKFGLTDFCIFDSWTAIAQSVDEKFAREMGIDLSSGEKTEEGLFGKDFKFLNWLLSQMNAINCHIGVVGHEQEYQKQRTVTEGGKQKRIAVGNPITQPISSSGRHSGMMGKHFSDVFYFKKTATGHTRIDTTATDERAGGSRHVPPGEYAWANPPAPDKNVPARLQFIDLCNYAGIPIVPLENVAPAEAVRWFRPGEMPEFPPTASGITATSIAGKPTVIGAIPAVKPVPAPATTTIGIPTTKPVTPPVLGGNNLLAALQKK